ncbi:MAG: HAMP domain-containing protein [Ardenticatenaceae bacterium]|nr:HAMP domain-containing protein [Ardenticatenaceae bacterium]
MFKRIFGGIGGQLLRSFLIVILISIGVLSFIVQQIPFHRINEIAAQMSQRQALQLAPLFVSYYELAGSWDQAQTLVEQFNQPLPENLAFEPKVGFLRNVNWSETLITNRIIITDATNRVVADSGKLLTVGQRLPTEFETQAVLLEQETAVIGQLVFVSGITPEFVGLLRNGFVRTIMWGGGLAAAIALLASMFLTRRIAQPVRQLNSAARVLSTGAAMVPLTVSGTDEIGELTQSFNDMADALEKQKQLRRQLVADIAHELRTPLSIMQLNVEALEDGLQPQKETAVSLHTEIATLARLIDDLRLLSLADTGGLRLEPELIDPVAFLLHLVQVWQVNAQAKQINLLAEVPGTLPNIQADQGRLAQVMNNLISNALRYAPTGGQVLVGAKESGSEIVFWVSDNGPGISAEALPHVFERFYRADPSRSRESGGSGLGLAIARRLVLLHNGRIWVESSPEQPTTFYIALKSSPASGPLPSAHP